MIFFACVGLNTPEVFALPAESADGFWMESAVASLSLASSVEQETVPAFSIAERDRSRVELQGHWMVAPNVRVELRWDWLHDAYPSGDDQSGAGDLRLSTVAELWSNPSSSLRAGWQVKLPNAADEGEMGTDETDAWLWLQGEHRVGTWTFWVLGGVGILGDPLRYTAQDDVPFGASGLRYQMEDASAWVPALRLASIGAPATSRNPARVRTDLGLEWGACTFARVESGLGWTSASPKQIFGVRVGQRWGCQSTPGD